MEQKTKCPTCGKAVHPELGEEWAGDLYCDDGCVMVKHDAYADGLRVYYEDEAAARWESPNISV